MGSNLLLSAWLSARMKLISAAALALLAACSSNVPAAKAPPHAAPAAAATAPAATVVDAQEARRLVASGVKVVDVRTPDEFAKGHVPGAVNIPYDEISSRAGEIGPASTPVLLYCHSGRRSGIAAQALRENGYSNLYDMKRYDVWTASEAGAASR
jgi:phage shock protein E